jgi:hypothetical protein
MSPIRRLGRRDRSAQLMCRASSSYSWEINPDIMQLGNRFATMTEVRRVAWPNFETRE